MPLPRALARFNRKATNQVLGRLAGRVPPFALVVHRGRVSGRVHTTPVWAFRTGRGYAVALTYGARSEWVRNVLAAGECGIVTVWGEDEMRNPRVLSGEKGRALMPSGFRPLLRGMGVSEVLSLERSRSGGPSA